MSYFVFAFLQFREPCWWRHSFGMWNHIFLGLHNNVVKYFYHLNLEYFPNSTGSRTETGKFVQYNLQIVLGMWIFLHQCFLRCKYYHYSCCSFWIYKKSNYFSILKIESYFFLSYRKWGKEHYSTWEKMIYLHMNTLTTIDLAYMKNLLLIWVVYLVVVIK